MRRENFRQPSFGWEANRKPELRFAAHQVTGNEDAELDFSARLVLDELGVEFEDPDANSLDAIIDRFDLRFPTTIEFSDLARLTLPQVRAEDEAQKIWPKHLATLEPAISPSQTEQMRAEQVQLVIPSTVHASYQEDQRTFLMSVADFIAIVSKRGRLSSA